MRAVEDVVLLGRVLLQEAAVDVVDEVARPPVQVRADRRHVGRREAGEEEPLPARREEVDHRLDVGCLDVLLPGDLDAARVEEDGAEAGDDPGPGAQGVVTDVEEERREDPVPLALRREDPLRDVPAAARLRSRVPRRPPLDGEEGEEGDRRHPGGAGGRDDGERRVERAEMGREARLQGAHPADRPDRVDRQDDDGRHLDDELDEVGPEDRPHARGGRVGDGDDEADADRPDRRDPERDAEDLHHREGDPAHDDEVDRQGEVEGAEAAEECRRPARVADLGELHVGHDLRAPPEPRVEEHGQRSAHDHVPPEPVAGDAVLGDEARHDERRVGGEGGGDHRGAREPPRNGSARHEVLLERLAALLRELEADSDRQREVGEDDSPVEKRQAHAGRRS